MSCRSHVNPGKHDDSGKPNEVNKNSDDPGNPSYSRNQPGITSTEHPYVKLLKQEGVEKDAESRQNSARLGTAGMVPADEEILRIMTERTDLVRAD